MATAAPNLLGIPREIRDQIYQALTLDDGPSVHHSHLDHLLIQAPFWLDEYRIRATSLTEVTAIPEEEVHVFEYLQSRARAYMKRRLAGNAPDGSSHSVNENEIIEALRTELESDTVQVASADFGLLRTGTAALINLSKTCRQLRAEVDPLVRQSILVWSDHADTLCRFGASIRDFARKVECVQLINFWNDYFAENEAWLAQVLRWFPNLKYLQFFCHGISCFRAYFAGPRSPDPRAVRLSRLILENSKMDVAAIPALPGLKAPIFGCRADILQRIKTWRLEDCDHDYELVDLQNLTEHLAISDTEL